MTWNINIISFTYQQLLPEEALLLEEASWEGCTLLIHSWQFYFYLYTLREQMRNVDSNIYNNLFLFLSDSGCKPTPTVSSAERPGSKQLWKTGWQIGSPPPSPFQSECLCCSFSVNCLTFWFDVGFKTEINLPFQS